MCSYLLKYEHMINRLISTEIAKTKKSVLLLGPRQAGKSTLISGLAPGLSINLADEMEFLTHSSRPDELQKLSSEKIVKTIFIDEVQRLPKILNTVQAIVDKNKGLKFYLTGSSARKLKRGGANLLPGRVVNFNLGPLAAAELGYEMSTAKALTVGSLPEAYLEESAVDAERLLRSYSANYLKEEIKAEALTRNLEAFARFMQESILSAGQFVDFSKLAKKAKISRHAVPRYFEIMEDTLIGYRTYPFQELQESQELVRHPKFYLFDNGVYNGMLGNFVASADRIGVLAEQLIFSQLIHSGWAQENALQVSTFRTRSGIEVDFILERQGSVFAIEVKSNDDISSQDCSGLEYFASVYPQVKGCFLLHMGRKEKHFGPIWALPWQRGLQEMGL
jgi:predicted AAA+ superfamily ATPase